MGSFGKIYKSRSRSSETSTHKGAGIASPPRIRRTRSPSWAIARVSAAPVLFRSAGSCRASPLPAAPPPPTALRSQVSSSAGAAPSYRRSKLVDQFGSKKREGLGLFPLARRPRARRVSFERIGARSPTSVPRGWGGGGGGPPAEIFQLFHTLLVRLAGKKERPASRTATSVGHTLRFHTLRAIHAACLARTPLPIFSLLHGRDRI